MFALASEITSLRWQYRLFSVVGRKKIKTFTNSIFPGKHSDKMILSLFSHQTESRLEAERCDVSLFHLPADSSVIQVTLQLIQIGRRWILHLKPLLKTQRNTHTHTRLIMFDCRCSEERGCRGHSSAQPVWLHSVSYANRSDLNKSPEMIQQWCSTHTHTHSDH